MLKLYGPNLTEYLCKLHVIMFQTHSKEWQSFVRFNVSLICSNAKTLEDDTFCKNKNFGCKILIFGLQNKKKYSSRLASLLYITKSSFQDES